MCKNCLAVAALMVCVALAGWVQVPLAAAQAVSLGIAQSLPIAVENLPDGSIIAHKQNTYQLSSEPYDKNMMGVVSRNAAISIQYLAEPDAPAVVSTGLVRVRVNSENGPIRLGDRLTSSSVPGVAMRATKTGFILGVAQEDVTPRADGSATVLVALDIGFDYAADSPGSELIGARLLSILQVSQAAVVDDPVTVFRYVVGAGVMISTLIFAFFTFGRVVRNGTEALGRNPIAAPHILLGMVFNLVISLAILGTGLGAAYIITIV